MCAWSVVVTSSPAGDRIQAKTRCNKATKNMCFTVLEIATVARLQLRETCRLEMCVSQELTDQLRVFFVTMQLAVISLCHKISKF